ncbi:hypothetical protein KP79_PYT20857 [Mizuhopecten yessoensis]|uniref:B box-type domain-containing protein n=1 Tax=Mizuhopecten yessoensis TaxID=6573 RepID=A0A210R0C5_MIZYE|nr:hypothetical protein KP79_PYT20857 [Mizuhopecten yessoensis]
MATCSEHHGQPFVMVCYSCDKCYSLVCCECIARKHKGHDLETFETAAKTVLDRLRTEKAKISTNLKEIHVDLKNYATIQENERKISENTRQYINRRRELLKLAIDEAAEILLEKQESSDKKIMDALLYGKQQAEDKVRNFLEFQSKLAMLETSTDYQHVIKFGKQMYFPNISKSLCPIPAVTRHILTRTMTFDRGLLRELFGEELEEVIRGSYILHCFDGIEDGETDSILTTDLFPNESEQLGGIIDSQEAESDGNVWVSRRQSQIDHPNVSLDFGTLDTSARIWSPQQIPYWNTTSQSSQ